MATSSHKTDEVSILEAMALEIKSLRSRVGTLENTEIIPGKVKDPSGTTTNSLTSSSGGNVFVGNVNIGASTATASALYVTGSTYVTNTVSASVFTDRTPCPDLDTARRAVYSLGMQKAGGGVDHDALDPFIKSPDGARDLSALVSSLTIVVQDQQKQIDKLSGCKF